MLKAELARLEPRLERNKAIVAIARKLLITVWYVLSQQAADRFAEPEVVARKLLKFAYQIGKDRRPAGQSAAQFVRQHLGCPSHRKRFVQHLPGLEETHPFATLGLAGESSERRPKHRIV